MHPNEIVITKGGWLPLVATALRWDIWYDTHKYTQALREQAKRQGFDVNLKEFNHESN